jgi:magnesium-transporting ATPase (P-type)
MNDQRQPNFWLRGRRETKKFYEIRLNRSTSFSTFIFGFLIAALLIFPIGLLIYQFLAIYGYNLSIFGVYLILIWLTLMLFNGLSNYLTVKIAQSSAKEIRNLQEIEAEYIFWYQLLNIGFGLFSLIIIVFSAIQILGAR